MWFGELTQWPRQRLELFSILEHGTIFIGSNPYLSFKGYSFSQTSEDLSLTNTCCGICKIHKNMYRKQKFTPVIGKTSEKLRGGIFFEKYRKQLLLLLSNIQPQNFITLLIGNNKIIFLLSSIFLCDKNFGSNSPFLTFPNY